MADLIVGGIIAGVLMVVEHLLCTKLKSPLWGGIIPLILLAGSIYIFACGTIPLDIKYIFLFVVLNTLYLGDWATGREKYKKMQQEEMNRMKAKDI